MAENCNFCKIDEEPYRIIRRTELITSFLSNPRLALGHVLIIPNRHLILPDQLNDDEVLSINSEANRLAGLMLGNIALGIDKWQKTRPEVPEGKIKRDHIHTHVLPSSPGQVLYDRAIDWGGPGWLPLEPEEAAGMVELLHIRDEVANP